MLEHLVSRLRDARETLALSTLLSRAWTFFIILELLLLSIVLHNQHLRTSPSETNTSLASHQIEAGYDPTKVAFMVETRGSGLLSAVFLHFLSVLPPEWTFHFVGTDSAIAYMQTRPAIQKFADSGRLRLSLLPTNTTIYDQESLSVFLTDRWLYESFLVPAENLLVFQTDSMICSKSNSTVNDFLDYSWIGAPFPEPEWTERNYGGNGGLNMRRVSALVDLLKHTQRVPGELYEDLWFVHALHKAGDQNIADFDAGRKFSVEAINWHWPLGYHTGHGGTMLWSNVFGSPKLRQELYDYCPEIKMTIKADIEQYVPGDCNENW